LITKRELAEFEQLTEIRSWLDATAFKPTTRAYYVRRLYQFLEGESPKAFIERALKNPREVSIEAKGKIGRLVTKLPSSAYHMRSAVKSFLEYNETGVHMNGKVKLRYKWQKPYISWEEAQRIINKTSKPYTAIFQFMLWTGIGEDEFVEINKSETIQKSIKTQMDNEKDYVKIDLEPRKRTVTNYFIMCLKKNVPPLPAYAGRHGAEPKLVNDMHLRDVFHRAAKEVELYQLGIGPHTLRSVFSSQCAKAGVAPAVAEFMKGHGSSDRYGYNREVLDPEFDVKELRKLWNMSKPASESEVNILRQENEKMRELLTLELQDTELSKHHDEIRAVLGKPVEGGPRAQKLSVRERNLQRELEEVDRKMAENNKRMKQLLKELEPRGRTG